MNDRQRRVQPDGNASCLTSSAERKPSRKRTWQYIERFDVKPADCALRLKRVIELGARPETLAACYDMWGFLVEELRTLVSEQFPAHKSGEGDADL